MERFLFYFEFWAELYTQNGKDSSIYRALKGEIKMAKSKMTVCKHCGQEIAASAKVCPHCGGKNKPPIYKRWWFIAIIVLIIFAAIGSSGSDSDSSSKASSSSAVSKAASTSSSSSISASTAVSSETASSAAAEPELSEADYKAACEVVAYKDLCRYPDKYAGTKIVIQVKVQQIMDASWLSNDKAWRVQTDNDGYGLYLDDEYYAIDKRSADSVKILTDDIVVIYGEFTGTTEVTRALTNTTDEIPSIDVKYADLVE